MDETKKRLEEAKEAFEEAARAKASISQNRGYEKEQARDGYDAVLFDLSAAVTALVETAVDDLDNKQLVALSKTIIAKIEKQIWQAER